MRRNAYRLMLRVKGSERSAEWAGRSVWYDRHVGIVEVAGSNPASSTILMFWFSPCKRPIACFKAFSQIFDAFKPISYAKFANSGFNSIAVLTWVIILLTSTFHTCPLYGWDFIGIAARPYRKRRA